MKLGTHFFVQPHSTGFDIWVSGVWLWLFHYPLQDNPEAKLEDLDKPGVDDEPQQVLLRFAMFVSGSWSPDNDKKFKCYVNCPILTCLHLFSL